MKRAFLQTHALFGGIDDAGIDAIEPLLKERHFKKGEFIFHEDDEGHELYFLHTGSAEILKEVDSREGKVVKQLAIIDEGEVLGEMELIDIQRRSASARALEDVSAVTMSNADLYRLHKSHPDVHVMIVMNIAREISRKLRRMDELVGSTIFSRKKKD